VRLAGDTGDLLDDDTDVAWEESDEQGREKRMRLVPV
jgi:hypothetical protein